MSLNKNGTGRPCQTDSTNTQAACSRVLVFMTEALVDNPFPAALNNANLQYSLLKRDSDLSNCMFG
jgi:hypothetical protein